MQTQREIKILRLWILLYTTLNTIQNKFEVNFVKFLFDKKTYQVLFDALWPSEGILFVLQLNWKGVKKPLKAAALC